MLACKLLAKQIIDDYRINEGVCIDLGSGAGWLGMEIAKLTDMTVHLVDINLERLSRAAVNLTESDAMAKVVIEQADAQHMPFVDDSDLEAERSGLHRRGHGEVHAHARKEGLGGKHRGGGQTPRATNTRAIHVYEKVGFRQAGRIPKGFFKNGSYIDRVIMAKEIG